MKRNITIGILLIVAGLAFSQSGMAHPSFNVGQALSALEKGDLESAEAELQKARFAIPDNPEIQYNLGVVSYRKRDYALAARQFALAAADQASSEIRFSSLYNMGNAVFRMGDYAAAVSAYEGCLELKKDEQAEYNLKVAREKLQKQLEKQKNSEKQQSQQNQNDKSSDQSGGEKSQNKEQQSQAGGNQQGQNAQPGQGDDSDRKDGDQQKQENGENKADQSTGADKKDESAQSNDAKDGKKSDAGESEQSRQKDNGSSEQGKENASGTQQLTEQQNGGEGEPREDVQMQPAESGAQNMPEASQRARALKNTKVNPYMIERVLKEMERREREAQLYYRNEPRRSDEIDPFEMDAQQLREWMEKRRRPQAPAPSDGPDW